MFIKTLLVYVCVLQVDTGTHKSTRTHTFGFTMNSKAFLTLVAPCALKLKAAKNNNESLLNHLLFTTKFKSYTTMHQLSIGKIVNRFCKRNTFFGVLSLKQKKKKIKEKLKKLTHW